ncbi:MAG: hypothetical protein ACUVYA_20190 [Planctomycetota bacterium]
MTGARWACAFLGAALVSSCASSGSPFASPPGEGVIAYHEPGRKGTLRSWIFASGRGEFVDEALAEARAGAIAGAGDTRFSSDEETAEIVKKVFGALPSTSTMVLSPERFADLWTRLEGAGLFALSTGEDRDPPEGRPYFLVKSGDFRRVFERPPLDPRFKGDPRYEADARRWYLSKKAFVDFLNEQ